MDVHSKNQILNQRLSKLQTEFILVDHGLCPDWSRLPHRRRRDSIYLILSGEGKITVNGQEIYPRKTIWYCSRKIRWYRCIRKMKRATTNIGAIL